MEKTLSTADITGVILAGGRGSRMGGQDKGLLEFNGRPLVEHLLDALKPQTSAVLINANRNQERYQTYGQPVVNDELTGFQGPLAGFAAAMQAAETACIMTVPCDGPQLAPDMAERLLQALQTENAELAVAHDGERLQPVHALIPVSLLPSLQTFLKNGDRKIDLWYAQHRMAQANFSDCRDMFRNINTPEDLKKIPPNPPFSKGGTGSEDNSLASPFEKGGLRGISPPILGVSAWSGSGKTTLLAELIPHLKFAGLRLTVIKHGHHKIELDTPGKDSYRFREAGADQVLLASRKRLAIMQECKTQREPELVDVLRFVNPDCADLVLVEGFKHTAIPKIEVHRPSLGKPLLFPQDSNVIALATDDMTLDVPPHIAKFDLNQPEQIAEFVLQWMKRGETPPNLPLSGEGQDGGSSVSSSPDKGRLGGVSSCADERDPTSLTVEEARGRIMDALQPVSPALKRPLRDALGQVLAEDVVSPINVPNHTNSAMDGYALRGDDLPGDEIREYRIIGTAFAGVPFTAGCGKGECVRIMTGAPMPAGTDTVVMQEQTEAGAQDFVRIGAGHRAGQNIRQAGEDIARDSVVLTAGRRINPADLGVLASLGVNEISVHRPLRVAFFSTGDELRSIGETLRDGEVYDSNRYALYGMLKQLNVDILDLGVARDDPVLMEAAFQQASAVADVVITSGGVSVGEADYTKVILDKLGQINFWKIAIKPGRPLAFGKLGEALFFGLPGNPVAVMVTFLQFVQPALLKLAGQQDCAPLLVDAICQSQLKKKPGRTEFQRGTVTRTTDGKLVVEKSGYQGSGVLTSMSKGNCLIILPAESATVEPGDVVQVQPFGW
ncbi:MAG: bifunctional molybdopterin-guanine dinucleotide biosynthesis adaptor protein MobB/molybdopterin molybdotransferase MoeA [Gammaproteobacteria bacterium]|nr:bifunctional molybdopterin-guanine dinucleotide biosynthesis adaptor protein MobB/molybdopterin molybdotransferase MoeA [Gammaproteobacteria bacterium]MBU1724630.1 bifunctional molybdopterin-guanine dinucleotide biosynthesis adaptor protein MobB/molybdopterin molybdotransferase MoeA [Gammaproteobacteria bacterium]MBU2004042.1 bifunctional molybdopterin-guanine dinucleotide biosynthesis adaptor protein MobB/molybdopterin molybdotransferase MoeA [Gammaproteobacteria bacterium]